MRRIPGATKKLEDSMFRPIELDSSRKIFTPRTELPCLFKRGLSDAIPSCPGSVPINPPATPDFAGMPTLTIHWPDASYMPDETITAWAKRAASAETTLSPVTGCFPPAERVAAITARSFTVTSTAHWAM